MRDQDYNNYIERLLNDHFEASQLLRHELTKGMVREKFIRDQINNQFGGSVNCVSGIMEVARRSEHIEYKQCDLVMYTHQIRKREIGTEYLINPQETLLIADIKSSLKPVHIREWEVIASKIKKSAKKEKWVDKTQIGLICYRYDNDSYKTLLKMFGFHYDRNLDTYEYRENIQKIFYLDYIFILHNHEGEDKRFLIRRIEKNKKDKFTNPYIFQTGDRASDDFWTFIYSLTLAVKK